MAMDKDATIERLKSLVTELSNDLEAEVESRRGSEVERRIERDLQVVRDAREALAGLNECAPSMPQGTHWSVEPHGEDGWAIYRGGDSENHGLNLGQLVRTTDEVAKQIEAALNAGRWGDPGQSSRN